MSCSGCSTFSSACCGYSVLIYRKTTGWRYCYWCSPWASVLAWTCYLGHVLHMILFLLIVVHLCRRLEVRSQSQLRSRYTEWSSDVGQFKWFCDEAVPSKHSNKELIDWFHQPAQSEHKTLARQQDYQHFTQNTQKRCLHGSFLMFGYGQEIIAVLLSLWR